LKNFVAYVCIILGPDYDSFSLNADTPLGEACAVQRKLPFRSG
jgi:hypothetical protein